jgi:hypothetical protein
MPETNKFFEAADIYVDSFPFVSITSMFEAGLHGIPVVTRYPFGSGCEVLGADSPGLDGVVIRTRSVEEIQDVVGRLVTDPALRAGIGRRTKAEIAAVNLDAAWKRALAGIYERAIALPRRDLEFAPTDEGARLTDLDLLVPLINGPPDRLGASDARIALAKEMDFEAISPRDRLLISARMMRGSAFGLRKSFKACRYLVPEWLRLYLRAAVVHRL